MYELPILFIVDTLKAHRKQEQVLFQKKLSLFLTSVGCSLFVYLTGEANNRKYEFNGFSSNYLSHSVVRQCEMDKEMLIISFRY